MPSMYEDGCELRPGSPEYRRRLTELRAAEANLRAQDRKDGGHRLRDFQNEQSQLWRQTQRNHRRHR
jgi:hypothetical protein